MRIFTPVFIIFLILILSLSVYANVDIGLEHYWSLNDTDFNDSFNTPESWDFIGGYAHLNYSTAKHPPDSLVLYFNEYAERYSTVDKVDLNQTMTFNFWMNQTGEDVGYILTYYPYLSESISILYVPTVKMYIDVQSCSMQDIELTLNVWNMLTLVLNTTGGSMYINGVLNSSCSGGSRTTDNSTDNFYMGDNGNANQWSFDEVGYWSVALTDSDISELYNLGEGLFYPFNISEPSSEPNISIVLNSPPNQFYSNDFINGFCFISTANYPIDVCHFYTNYSGILESNVTLFNVTNGTISCLNWNSVDYGSYIWGIWCNTTSGGGVFSEYRDLFIVNETISSCYYSKTPTLKMSIPFIQSGSIDWFCEIGFKNVSCFTSVIKDGNTIQVNPAPVSVDSVGSIDSFIGSDSLVSSYVRVSFNQKNLLPENEFQFIVICSNPTQYIRINASVIPEYNQIKGLGSRMIWVKDSVPYIIGLTLILIIGGFTWYFIRNR
jgi:hypothetical protein